MNRIVMAVMAVLWAALPASAQDAPATTEREPTEVVDTLHTGLLDIMQRANDLGFAGRAETIGPIVKNSFDIEILGASAIGISVWRTWTDDQKQTYEDTFSRFLIANYAYQFDAFSGQNFQVIDNEGGPKETTLVKSHLVRPDKEPVELTYLTRIRKGRVGIIDVYSDGTISEAARRRSEFATIYRDAGFDGLISSIEKQISDLASGITTPESG
jgi:phospholipid transport system substrate-binding protein